MASATLRANDRFPVGTSLAVYPAQNRIDGHSPSGSAVTSATVASDSTVTFTSLTDGAYYVAYASVGGEHRYMAFATNPQTAESGRLSVTAEAPLNVEWPEYGADGTGVADSSVAIQAAIIVAAAAKGEVILPGDYLVDTALTFPLNSPVTLRGVGRGRATAGGSRLRRTGTNPIISAVGTGDTTATRVALALHGLMLDGASTAGTVLQIQRANDVLIDDVRVGWSGAVGCQFTQLWNCDIDHLRVNNCGNGAVSPAVLFDANAGSGSQGGSATVACSNWELEGNAGTCLKFAGSSGDSAPTNDIEFTNVKLEGANGSFPYIDLDYAQSVKFLGGLINRGASHSGVLVQQLGTSGGSLANVFSGFTLDASQGTALAHYVDMGVGGLILAAVALLGAPTTAFCRVRSTVNAGRFKLDPDGLVTNVARDDLILDERAMPNVASAATLTLPLGSFISVTGTTTITAITATYPGDVVTLIFASTAQVTDGANLKIAGNFTGGAGRTLTLRCDGTDFYEIARSTN